MTWIRGSKNWRHKILLLASGTKVRIKWSGVQTYDQTVLKIQRIINIHITFLKIRMLLLDTICLITTFWRWASNRASNNFYFIAHNVFYSCYKVTEHPCYTYSNSGTPRCLQLCARIVMQRHGIMLCYFLRKKLWSLPNLLRTPEESAWILWCMIHQKVSNIWRSGSSIHMFCCWQ